MGEWIVHEASSLVIPGASIARNEAMVSLAGPGSSFGALSNLDDNDGTLTLDEGRDFTAVGSWSQTGTLELGPGSELTVPDDYTQGAQAILSITLAGTTQDLIQVIVDWGPCPPDPEPCLGDVDGDDMVDVQDLVSVVVAWG